MSKDNGGPAFPAGYGYAQADELGMTLRDYFAAKAMQVFIADSYSSEHVWADAEEAYRVADAMLAERAK